MQKRVQLFQYNIFSVVNQGGHPSNNVFIHVHRGCRQVDPIYWYNFILCVEILDCIRRQNKLLNAYGININNQNINLS